jgi:hypothetical protein
MRNLCAVFVTAIGIVCAAPRAAAPAAPSTIIVVTGGWVNLPLSGAGRVDTAPAENAFAWNTGDSVSVYGLHPGPAVLTLTYPDSIEARLVQVVAAAPPAPTLEGDQDAGCAGPLRVRSADQSHLALDANGISFSAFNALVTPLESLGVPVAPGVDAEWQPGWQIMASPTLGLVGYHLAGAGGLMVGDSVLGPAVLMDAGVGPAHISAAGVRTPSGQLISAADASFRLGSMSLGYATGPSGGTPTIGYQHGPFSVSAAATPGQGVQLGVGYSLGDGMNVGGGWGTDGSWRASVALALGPGGGPAPSKTAGCAR